ncbi:MAG: ChaN family lipoprotein, partial [Elusimicrobiales bacterium]
MIFIPLILNALDYTIINGKKEITMDTFRKMLHRSDIVYIGETHTSTFSHSVQLEVIRMMYEKNKKICVGFEMLNKTLQPWLDKYLTGEISEDEFLNGINWEKEWGFDFSLYRPIFSFVKDNKLKALALNLPRRVVSKVARGGIDALSEDEKKLMAKNIKVNKNRRYKKYLENTFYTGDENPMNKIMTFENYTLSMAVWNETMGERVAEFINLNPGYSFVVIAGNGHIIYNAAIPWSV